MQLVLGAAESLATRGSASARHSSISPIAYSSAFVHFPIGPSADINSIDVP